MEKVVLLNEYRLGDMRALYYVGHETKNVELMLLPDDVKQVSWDEKKQVVDSLVQIKLAGDIYQGGYAGG